MSSRVPLVPVGVCHRCHRQHRLVAGGPGVRVHVLVRHDRPAPRPLRWLVGAVVPCRGSGRSPAYVDPATAALVRLDYRVGIFDGTRWVRPATRY
jgi:hypothetical protein